MKRNHPLSIIYFSLSLRSVIDWFFYFFSLNLAVTSIFDYLDMQKAGIGILSFFLLVIIVIAFRAWVWYKTSYDYDDKVITFTKVTRLRVKKITLKASKIASITRDQSLFLRMCGIYRVSVTNDTSAGDKSDSIDLFLSEAESDLIIANFDEDQREQLVNQEDGISVADDSAPKQTVYRHTVKDMIIFPFVDNPTIYFVFLGYLYLIYAYGIEVEGSLFTTVLFLFGIISPFIKSFLSGANLSLTVADNSNNLDVESGLLGRKKNRFSKANIRMFEYKYSRIIKRAHARVGVVGANTDEEVDSYQPISLYVEKRTISELQELCGFATDDLKYYRPHRISLIFGIFLSLITTIIFLLVIAFIYWVSAEVDFINIPLFIYPLTLVLTLGIASYTVIKQYLNFKHTCYFAINDEFIVVSDGYITQKIDIFRYNNAQSLQISTDPIARKLGTADLEIDLFDVSQGAGQFMLNYNKSDILEVEAIIKKRIKGGQ